MISLFSSVDTQSLLQASSSRCRPALHRRRASRATAQPVLTEQAPLATEVVRGERRVAYRKEGWRKWMFEGKHKTNYIQAGDRGPILLLIHGFGASAFHWRYNIPALAQNHRVFSLCLLGFGWSDKPLLEGYGDYSIWLQQVQDFIREVVQPGSERVVLAGNSLGGYVALRTAAENPAAVSGVVLLNAAGKFQDVKEVVVKEVETALGTEEGGAPLAASVRQVSTGEQPGSSSSSSSSSNGTGLAAAARVALKGSASGAEDESLVSRLTAPFKEVAKRGAVYLAFLAAKQPARIKQVLEQVYFDKAYLDEDLVTSIVEPARDPNAAEVFYRIITGQGEPVNVLLDRLQGTPLLLLWGRHDPWIRPATADKIVGLYPAADLVFVEGGHCPHDDCPQATNQALEKWVAAL